MRRPASRARGDRSGSGDEDAQSRRTRQSARSSRAMASSAAIYEPRFRAGEERFRDLHIFIDRHLFWARRGGALIRMSPDSQDGSRRRVNTAQGPARGKSPGNRCVDISLGRSRHPAPISAKNASSAESRVSHLQSRDQIDGRGILARPRQRRSPRPPSDKEPEPRRDGRPSAADATEERTVRLTPSCPAQCRRREIISRQALRGATALVTLRRVWRAPRPESRPPP